MKDLFVIDLKKDMEIKDVFFMVKSVAVKIGSTGKQYLDVTLGDKTGEITAKKWEVSQPDTLIQERDIVRVAALVTEYNGQNQLRIQWIRNTSDEDKRLYVSMEDYVKAAPEKPEDMYRYIMSAAEEMKDSDLRNLCVKVLSDNREKLMYYPAAQKNHHAELAGLLYHTKRMLMTGKKVCEVYTSLNCDLVCCGVIMHDMEKMNEIISGDDGVATGYSFEGQLLGHIIMGVKSVDRIAEELGFSTEKRIMVEHMILAHHYEPEYGSPKKPMFPEAEVLHYLDILDARIYDMEQALSLTEPGKFSDKIWTLDNRKIYNPVEKND